MYRTDPIIFNRAHIYPYNHYPSRHQGILDSAHLTYRTNNHLISLPTNVSFYYMSIHLSYGTLNEYTHTQQINYTKTH